MPLHLGMMKGLPAMGAEFDGHAIAPGQGPVRQPHFGRVKISQNFQHAITSFQGVNVGSKKGGLSLAAAI
jgi:hypothetical protein